MRKYLLFLLLMFCSLELKASPIQYTMGFEGFHSDHPGVTQHTCVDWLRSRGVALDQIRECNDDPQAGTKGVNKQFLGALDASHTYCGKTEVDGIMEDTFFCKDWFFSAWNKVTFERINNDPINSVYRVEGHRCNNPFPASVKPTDGNLNSRLKDSGLQYCRNDIVCANGNIIGGPVRVGEVCPFGAWSCVPVYLPRLDCSRDKGHKDWWGIDKVLEFDNSRIGAGTRDKSKNEDFLIGAQKAYLVRTTIGAKYYHGGVNDTNSHKICAYMDYWTKKKSLIGCMNELPKPLPPTFNIVYSKGVGVYLKSVGGNFYQPSVILAKGEDEITLTLSSPNDECDNPSNFRGFSGDSRSYCAMINPNNVAKVCVCDTDGCPQGRFIGCGDRATPDPIVAEYIFNYDAELNTLVPTVKPVFTKTGNLNDFWGDRANAPELKEFEVLSRCTATECTDADGNPINRIKFLNKPEVEMLGIRFRAIIPEFEGSKPKYSNILVVNVEENESGNPICSPSSTCSASSFATITGNYDSDSMCRGVVFRTYTPIGDDGTRLDDVDNMCKNTILDKYGIDIDTCGDNSPTEVNEAIRIACPGLYSRGSGNKICLEVKTEWEALQDEITKGTPSEPVVFGNRKHRLCVDIPNYFCEPETDSISGAHWPAALATASPEAVEGECLASLGKEAPISGSLPTAQCMLEDNGGGTSTPRRVINRQGRTGICEDIDSYTENGVTIKLCPPITTHSPENGDCLYSAFSSNDFLEVSESSTSPTRLWSAYTGNSNYRPVLLSNGDYVFKKSVAGTNCLGDQYELTCKITARRGSKGMSDILTRDDIVGFEWEAEDDVTSPCPLCPDWGLGVSTQVSNAHCGTSGTKAIANSRGLRNCTRSTFISWMRSSDNSYSIKGCGYTLSDSEIARNHEHSHWEAYCHPCTNDGDCAPAGNFIHGGKTKSWNSAFRCFDSAGRTNTGNAGYCHTNINEAKGCSRACNTP